jgi:hypothetical protein
VTQPEPEKQRAIGQFSFRDLRFVFECLPHPAFTATVRPEVFYSSEGHG